MKIIKPKVTLIQITPNAEKFIEKCGRICYKSEDKITENSHINFIKHLLKNGHLSVIEHAIASFHIVCDRGISHEIVRHRIASYSQESTRYVKYDNIEIVNPSFIEGTDKYNAWYNSCKASEISYTTLIKNGVKPQIARSVLPTCLKTELIMTTNFREWYHFLKLRLSSSAHPQIREVAAAVLFLLNKYSSTIFNFDNFKEFNYKYLDNIEIKDLVEKKINKI